MYIKAIVMLLNSCCVSVNCVKNIATHLSTGSQEPFGRIKTDYINIRFLLPPMRKQKPEYLFTSENNNLETTIR